MKRLKRNFHDFDTGLLTGLKNLHKNLDVNKNIYYLCE